MPDHFSSFVIDSLDWGQIKILRVLPVKGDAWGFLAGLRDTVWGKQIPIVSGQALSDALHGHATPLMREIGPDPDGLMRLIPNPFRICKLKTQCLAFNKNCHPCRKLPDCYIPPGLPETLSYTANLVAQAWKEGRYVIVVDGQEFS